MEFPVKQAENSGLSQGRAFGKALDSQALVDKCRAYITYIGCGANLNLWAAPGLYSPACSWSPQQNQQTLQFCIRCNVQKQLWVAECALVV